MGNWDERWSNAVHGLRCERGGTLTHRSRLDTSQGHTQKGEGGEDVDQLSREHPLILVVSERARYVECCW